MVRRLIAGVVMTMGLVGVPASGAFADPGAFHLSTSPSMTPAFSPSVTDYAIGCAGGSATVFVGGEAATVAGRSVSASSSVTVPMTAGQQIVVKRPGIATYHLRCVPADFPAYSSTRSGDVQSTGFLVQPGISFTANVSQPYTIAFNADGVPVWWHRSADGSHPIDAKFLDASTIEWAEAGVVYLHDLVGNVTKEFHGPDGPLDLHDFIVLPGDRYLGLEYVKRDCPATPSDCVDLSSWGRSTEEALTDAKLVEFDGDGNVVWTWRMCDHIDVATENQHWRGHGVAQDVVHMNSLAYDGRGGVVVSARHLDAVYRIKLSNGAITWKLGGSWEHESLRVVGPPGFDAFSGQHFARILPDGSLTLHDNRTKESQPPRLIHYALDLHARTATVLGWVTDPRVSGSHCCGNGYLLPGGNWVADWGAANFITELTPWGAPVVTIDFDGIFAYRVEPIETSLGALRRAMDVTYPRAQAPPSPS